MTVAQAWELKDTAVHLWWADLDDAAASASSHPEDLCHAAAVYDLTRKRRLLIRRALLRNLLAAYLGRRAASTPLRWRGGGRPELAPPCSDLRFSLASSGRTAFFGVTRQHAIGVDVERRPEAGRLAALAEHFLTPVERGVVEQLAGADQERELLRFWTLKEAVAKGLGSGLSGPLEQMQVGPDLARPTLSLASPWPADGVTGWRLSLVPTAGGVVAALAVKDGWDELRQARMQPRRHGGQPCWI